MIKLTLDNAEITDMMMTGTLEGSKTSVSRAFDFSIVSSPTDKTVPVVNVKVGGEVKLEKDDKVLYEGLVYSHDIGITQDSINLKCYDCLYPLVKSTVTYNFTQKTPGEITKTIFNDLGIPFAGSPIAGDPVDRIFENVNAYDAVMTVWTLQSKVDGKKYMVTSRDGKGAIVEVGKAVGKYILNPKSSILDANYSESGESIVSTVNTYDDSGNKVGTQKLSDNPLPIEIFHSVKADQDPKEVLHGIDREASITILGDLDCVAGRGIVIKEEYTGLYGLFYIESDKHTFDNNMITTELELAFEKTMDEKEAGNLEKDEAFGFGGEGGVMQGNSTQAQIYNFFKSKGYTDSAIAGIIGNFVQESGLNPKSENSIGAFGLAQWLGPRRRALEAFAKSKGKSASDISVQLEFAHKELMDMKGGKNYMKMSDPKKAALWWSKKFERPGKSEANNPRRVKEAEKAMDLFKTQVKYPTPQGGGNNGLINYAKTRIGSKYVYGSANSSGSIDCSGLVWRSMQANGYKGGRFTTRDMAGMARKGILQEIPLSQRKPGDILWMPGHTGLCYSGDKSLEATPPKVGIYSFNYQRWTKCYRWTGK